MPKRRSLLLEGVTAFAEMEPGFPPGAQYPTRKHPIQSFQWADYMPNHRYTYTVAALKGRPANLTPHAATRVESGGLGPAAGATASSAR